MPNLNLVHLILNILKLGDAEFSTLLGCEVFLEILQCLLEHRISLHVDGICVFRRANMCKLNGVNTPDMQSVIRKRKEFKAADGFSADKKRLTNLFGQ